MIKPEISEKFTMEDIRKIRDFNSARHNSMTRQQVIDDINGGAEKILKRLEEYKHLH
jgi:hypothetical protein